MINPPHSSQDVSRKSRVTIAREDRGLSKEKLAVLAGTSVKTLDRVEDGAEPDPLLRETLAVALEVSTGALAD